jgi:glycosyltransferase involved in cell wall biosynthesis
MKLLISTYACLPNRGSDHGVGWNWTTEAHRLGHEVWALVSPAHRNAIEDACQTDAVARGIHWIFPKLSYWPLQPAKEPKWERTYNLLWQRAALRSAREFHRRVGFDAIHHLTWGGVRAPTYLGSLGPPLIIGPIGGGETSPSSLRDGFGLRGRILETVRDLSNATITINPLVRGGLSRASIIFAYTADTRNLFRGPLAKKTVVFSPLGIQREQLGSPRTPRQTPPRLLYAGRLFYWKGVHIALQAFAKLLTKIPNARFTIVGTGPEEARLKADTLNRNIKDNVDFISWLPQKKLFELYDSHDLLLFPSLHDSGGFVVLEALSHGMPVVCLDLGGPKETVTPDSGLVIKTDGRNTTQVASSIAEEVYNTLQSPTSLAQLSSGAISRASDFILPIRVARFYREALRFIEADVTGCAAPPAWSRAEAANQCRLDSLNRVV